MKKGTPEGMRDYLPDDAALRDEMIGKITSTYRSAGFRKISTPIVETAENLDGSDGGDNLKLIFRILKRGEKLEKAFASGEGAASLSDLGLRYDLTLPLARYYANNCAKLPDPFKCIQIGRVYRAERAQRGRMREFVQCDIDILGSDSTDCETELIMVTAEALKNLGIKDFTVKLNNRALVKSVIISSGFTEEQVNSVCISIDKLDKIGTDGVRDELIEKGFDTAAVEKLMDMLGGGSLDEFMDYDGAAQIDRIMKNVDSISEGKVRTCFDITLVRGQGYYTGCVFEIVSEEYGGTIAGGGRYNGLVERFTGSSVPAVGFSIGFERIFTILSERGAAAKSSPKAAVIYNDGDIVRAMKYAAKLKPEYDVCLVLRKKQLGKQLNALSAQSIAYAAVLGETDEWKKLN